MSERKTFLRILYTIDGSIQYILARSLTPVSITVISRDEDSRATLPDGSRLSALYASVSLKTCLETIRRSSPELMQDPTLDYSLYVLDPLESNSAPAPVNISNTHGDATGLSKGATEQPGVAVGLGLMSWALMSSDRDSICVTGTLGKQHTGQETLEVVFALRKVGYLCCIPAMILLNYFVMARRWLSRKGLGMCHHRRCNPRLVLKIMLQLRCQIKCHRNGTQRLM